MQITIGRAAQFPVPQEHALGCAVACVAYRAGRPYKEALALFDNGAHAWLRGYFCDEVVTALTRAGYRYAFDRFDSLRHFMLLDRVGTIVFVEPSAEYPAGHYVIRAQGGWMNSWQNYPVMIPVEASVQPDLPGRPEYVIYELG